MPPALAFVVGCGSSPSSNSTADASIERDLQRGVAEIRGSTDRHKLYSDLARLIASLRGDRATTAAGRRARRLAIDRFEATRKGTRSQLDFVENDRGNIAAATRDAKRADRYLRLGANRLRAAGRELGIRIGRLNQY